MGATYLLIIVIPFLFGQINFWEESPIYTGTFPNALRKEVVKRYNTHSG